MICKLLLVWPMTHWALHGGGEGEGGGYFGTDGGAHSVKCTVSNASSSSTSPLLAPLWVADYGSMRGAGGKCFGPADGPLPTGS